MTPAAEEVVVRVDVAGEIPPDSGGPADAPFAGRTLRLALAMRGGVSLAVWIGGAVAELDLLRSLRIVSLSPLTVSLAWDQAAAPGPHVLERAKLYGRMLAGRKYQRVEIDVLAGASAGGLNSILLGAAQRAGRSVDSVIGVWKTAGGIEQLLHPPGWGLVNSVLRGDDFFYPRVLEALEAFHDAPPHPGLVHDAVTIDLSATVINANDSRHPAVREGRAGFHFAAGSAGNDIPANGAEDRELSLQRLALAARTTSSYPGAFEPATIWSLGVSPGGDDAVALAERAALDGTDARCIDMSTAFLEHRADSVAGPYLAVDGGVFDNIPISRAFRAIRPRSADVPVKRGLVYLDPSPPEPEPTPPRRATGFSDFVSVIARVLAARTRGESSHEDEEEIRAYSTEHWVDDGLLDPFAAAVRDAELTTCPEGADEPPDAAESAPSASAVLWERRLRAYARARVSRDGALISQLLRNTETWELGLPGPQRGLWTMDEASIEPWLRAWENSLVEVANAGEVADDIVRDARGLVDAASWIILAVQWLELVSGAATGPPDPTGSDTVDSHASLRRDVRIAAYAARATGQAALDAAARAVVSSAHLGVPAEEAVGLWWTPVEDGWDEIATALGTLRDLHDAWATLAPPLVEDGNSAFLWWDEAPWKHLHAMPLDDTTAVRIAPLMASLGEAGVVEPPIYLRLDAGWRWGDVAAGSDLAPALTVLRSERVRVVAQQILSDGGGEERAALLAQRLADGGRIPAKTKLAGTSIANFGGFLSVDWRVADWWWGRADAAAFLADALRHDPPEEPVASPDELASLVAAQRVAAQPVAAQPVAVLPGAAEDADPFTMGVGGLGRLSGTYLVRVVSRLVRVAARALPGVRSAAGSVGIHVLLRVLAPVLIAVPAVVQIPRLAAFLTLMAAGTVAASAVDVAAVGPAPLPLAILGVFVVAPAVAVLVGIVAAASHHRARWNILRAVLLPSHLLPSAVDTAQRRAAWSGAAACLTAVVSVAAASVSWWAGNAPLTVLWGLASLGAVALARRLLVRMPPPQAKPDASRRLWLVIAAASAGALVVALGFQTFAVLTAAAAVDALPPSSVHVVGDGGRWTLVALALGGCVLLWGTTGFLWSTAVAVTAVAVAGSALAVGVWLGGSGAASPAVIGWVWVVAVVLWANTIWLIPSWYAPPPAAGGDEVHPLRSA